MRGLFIALAVAIPAGAYAADWKIPSDGLVKALPSGCDASSDAGLYTCAAKAFEKADSELNAVWQKALATIEPGSSHLPDDIPAAQVSEWKDDLIAAQRAWNAFKDMDCDGARGFEYWGGTARTLAVLSCKYEYTVDRTNDLRARYLDQ